MITKVVSRLCVLFFILVFSQLPVFVDQYALRLQGHLAESNRQVEAFSTAASIGGKTLDQYISKFLEQKDADFKNQGTLMKEAVERNSFLARACEALHNANPLFRPLVFIRYVDNQVLVDSWKTFTPGVSFTLNVGLWALIGCVFGWCVVFAIKGAFSSGKIEPKK